MRVDGWAAYGSTRRWPQLDGLRTVSILMVLTVHMHDSLWAPLRGGRGVTLFFVISGFLITTLLLREEGRKGAVSLRGFYIRRFFRIVPLYAAALLLATVLVVGLGQGQGGGDFVERLPLLATFNGEFAGSGTFSHSWSLGIEEKFYVLWPLLVALPFTRARLGLISGVIVPVAAVAAFVPGVGYFGIYLPILAGCALAIAMHSPRTYEVVRHLARPVPAYLLLALFLLVVFFEKSLGLREQWEHAHVLFGLSAALVFPGVLIGHTLHRRALSWAPVAWFGVLAYPIYLFHPFVLEVVDRAIEPGSGNLALVLVRFAAVVAVSTVVGVLANRVYADPLNAWGHRLAHSSHSFGRVDPEGVETPRSDESART